MAKPKVIGYTRVSTSEQVEGFGLDVQEAAIRKYCKAEGLRLVALLTDQGQSGSNGLDDRLGLAEGLARIERGEATGLVVYRWTGWQGTFCSKKQFMLVLRRSVLRSSQCRNPRWRGTTRLGFWSVNCWVGSPSTSERSSRAS